MVVLTELAQRIDSKDGIVARDRLESGDWRVVRNRQVLPTACSNLGPCLEDPSALVRRDLGEVDGVRPTSLD